MPGPARTFMVLDIETVGEVEVAVGVGVVVAVGVGGGVGVCVSVGVGVSVASSATSLTSNAFIRSDSDVTSSTIASTFSARLSSVKAAS